MCPTSALYFHAAALCISLFVIIIYALNVLYMGFVVEFIWVTLMIFSCGSPSKFITSVIRIPHRSQATGLTIMMFHYSESPVVSSPVCLRYVMSCL